MRKRNLFMMLIFLLVFATNIAFSGETMPDIVLKNLSVGLDTVWVLLTGLLVFFMNTGFAMVESGLIRAKNTVNVLAKNFIVFAITTFAYWFIGWGIMFGDGNDFMGLKGLFFVNNGVDGVYSSISWTQVPLWAKFFFQLVFAGTAATIVSGAVAERIKFLSFIIFSTLLGIFIYPIVGHWIWGGGWLAKMGMFDFAGSTVVHSVGGWSALAGVLLLGPRTGKYRKDGSVNPIMGHNLSLVTLGGFILWFGWFGFNPGSTMTVGDGKAIAHIFITTNTAAIMAIISSTISSWIIQKKPDLTMIINGALAGLVAITAPCAFVTINVSALIGLIAGILVVVFVVTFDKLKIDDPVGALSVHLVNGIFGTISVGLFAKDGITGVATGNGLFYGGGLKLLGAQLTGVIAVGLYTFLMAFLIWFILKALIGIRVSKEEEILGLDIGEHGQEAYPDFQGFVTK
ncbi:MAG: ammonium transporter [Brevinematia bacterium]